MRYFEYRDLGVAAFTEQDVQYLAQMERDLEEAERRIEELESRLENMMEANNLWSGR